MAHLTVRHYQSKEGLKWTAAQAVWNSDLSKYQEKKIDSVALIALAFSDNMTPDQAKIHAKKLNALSAVQRKEQATQLKASERLTNLITIENSIIPNEMSNAFVNYMEEHWYGGDIICVSKFSIGTMFKKF
ncbi:hypothetical protein [Bdellovibrio bacteriovorus]|uniref:hypothetical protein n=1 Tax=Bdellovibrio bacteriovorus TaxID=959 RepID=UPI0035A6C94D